MSETQVLGADRGHEWLESNTQVPYVHRRPGANRRGTRTIHRPVKLKLGEAAAGRISGTGDRRR